MSPGTPNGRAGTARTYRRDVPNSTTRAPLALLVRLRSVGRRSDERPVLDALDLNVTASEMVAIDGLSGYSKSTMLSQVNGDQPDAGTDEIDDSPIRPIGQ